MHIQQLRIKNFRAIEDIDVAFDAAVNVIVGPNAIGKSTLLEAIRLAKAMLAPRTPNEALQTLISLGGVSPHQPQKLNPESIARRNGPVSIKCTFKLTEEELASIEANISLLATNQVQAKMGQAFSNPTALSTFLSSTQGRSALDQSEKELQVGCKSVRVNQSLVRLELTIDFVAGRIDGGEGVGPAFVAFIDQRHPSNQTSFSYFPADRAMPPGEQPVQIGVADAGPQLESHSSQPHTKYTRLKSTIFNAVIAGDTARNQLQQDFANIFASVLRGRTLVNVGVGSSGLLSIEVKDNESGNKFGIDAMSSGEKGLILTCLLLSQSMVEGGVVLLDEPELHLSPAVCKTLLAFLIEHYVKPKKLQLIVCSHSPEILAGAIDSEDCSLYHLVSSTVISKVRKRDNDEVTDALSSLGTSESEGLLYRSTIFVEGDEDLEVLEAGFSDTLRRHKLKDLGGRKEVEKQILKLQKLETEGNETTPRYFIFDRDNAPSDLKDSKTIKVLQWDRRCLENYLIDMEALTGLLKDPDFVARPVANQGELSKKLIALAKSQLDEQVARDVYASYTYESPGLRASEIKGKSLDEISKVLFARLEGVKNQSAGFVDGWEAKFLKDCEKVRSELDAVWDASWQEKCDGKRLFGDLHREVGVKVSLRKFKRRVIAEMRKTPPSANWKSVDGLLKTLIGE